jgi:hypothetical protein
MDQRIALIYHTNYMDCAKDCKGCKVAASIHSDQPWDCQKEVK